MTTEQTKTYVCIARCYRLGKLYERGERITVPASMPMSRAWRDPSAELPEFVPQGPETAVPQGPELEPKKAPAPKATPPSPPKGRISDKSL